MIRRLVFSRLPAAARWRAVLPSLAFLAFLLCLPVAPAISQALTAPAPAEEEAPAPVDPYGRGTPEGTVAGFVDAIANQDYERASVYLNLEDIPRSRRHKRGQALARQLQTLLDRGGQFLPRATISNTATGHLDDELDPKVDQVGTIRGGKESVPLLVEQVDSETGPIWVIAAETLDAVPDLLAEGENSDAATLLERWLPEPFLKTDVLGAPVGHWLALFGLTLLSYLASWLLIAIGLQIDAWWYRRRHREARSVFSTLAPPLRLWIAAVAVTFIAPRLGLSIVARELFGRVIQVVAWIAFAWLAWRVIDAIGGVIIRRLQQRGTGQIASIAAFIRRLIKAVIVVIGIIAIFDTLGYDMTAGIAALGVGGLALALGAQKLIENLVASVTILADQPVRVGEFCKVGDTMGTIEELGIRSTKIRTLDQTLVVIPNSDFAAKQIENYSRRGQFWFHPMINLHQETSPEQVRLLLERLRTLLAKDSRFPEPPRVRLLGVGNDRLPIEIFSYVLVPDYDAFLAVQEEVTLQILDLVAELGLRLAPPTFSSLGPAPSSRPPAG